MKFKFPFQNVLKHRKVLEDLAQREFQESLSVFILETKKLEDMKGEVNKAHQHAFEKQQDGGKAAAALGQVYDFLLGQDVRIDRQQLKVQELNNRVEELREILRLKAIDYKMIEKLKEKKTAEFKKERNHIEQKNTDDLSIMRSRIKIE